MRRKLTKAEKQAKRERKKNTMIIFVHGKQKRVPRPAMIDGIPVDEFIRQNADPIQLVQNEMWEYLHADDEIGNPDMDRMEPSTPKVALPLVHLFTDGACIGNPGPGGWAFILKHPASGKTWESSGGEHHTTNNRMEIMAVIAGLETLKFPCEVNLFSDSEYVVNAIREWMAKWKSRNWKRKIRSPLSVKNADLWQRLDALRQIHTVNAQWVRGHAGHAENERCDVRAVAAAAAVAKTPAPPKAEVPPAIPIIAETLFDKPGDAPAIHKSQRDSPTAPATLTIIARDAGV